ncbi:MAG TPA: hypothetical protein VGL75_10945 [Acidothermaceae bacterium]|jgi:hypothetical protein
MTKTTATTLDRPTVETCPSWCVGAGKGCNATYDPAVGDVPAKHYGAELRISLGVHDTFGPVEALVVATGQPGARAIVRLFDEETTVSFFLEQAVGASKPSVRVEYNETLQSAPLAPRDAVKLAEMLTAMR